MRRNRHSGARAAIAFAVVAFVALGAAPWPMAAADGPCCSMPSCCDEPGAGCERSPSVGAPGCCGPAEAPATPAGPGPGSGRLAPDAASVAPIPPAMATDPRDALLLADRSVTDGPASPVPLFTAHASLLL